MESNIEIIVGIILLIGLFLTIGKYDSKHEVN
jgi:hypothetical protein